MSRRPVTAYTDETLTRLALPARRSSGKRGLEEIHGAEQVHFENALPFGLAGLRERNARADAGVVDQRVDFSKSLDRTAHRGSALVEVRDVCRGGFDLRARHLRADRLGASLQRLCIAIHEQHLRTFRAEDSRRRCSDTRAAAGDDRDLAFQTLCHFLFFSFGFYGNASPRCARRSARCAAETEISLSKIAGYHSTGFSFFNASVFRNSSKKGRT